MWLPKGNEVVLATENSDEPKYFSRYNERPAEESWFNSRQAQEIFLFSQGLQTGTVGPI